jgi:hypothetical protein
MTPGERPPSYERLRAEWESGGGPYDAPRFVEAFVDQLFAAWQADREALERARQALRLMLVAVDESPGASATADAYNAVRRALAELDAAQGEGSQT